MIETRLQWTERIILGFKFFFFLFFFVSKASCAGFTVAGIVTLWCLSYFDLAGGVFFFFMYISWVSSIALSFVDCIVLALLFFFSIIKAIKGTMALYSSEFVVMLCSLVKAV